MCVTCYISGRINVQNIPASLEGNTCHGSDSEGH